MSKKFEKGKMVEFPSTAIIPERDLDKTPVLECRHLGIDFGGLRAVDDFNLTIGRTEIAGLIGPNGAGKTTVFNLLTKVYQPTRGTILLDGMDTSGKTTEQINRMGIARTFQNIRLFSNLTVEDNVKIGLHNQEPYSTFEGIFRLPRYWRQERWSCCPFSICRTWQTCRPARCPTARSAVWRSSALWQRIRRCCCSTSPPPA